MKKRDLDLHLSLVLSSSLPHAWDLFRFLVHLQCKGL